MNTAASNIGPVEGEINKNGKRTKRQLLSDEQKQEIWCYMKQEEEKGHRITNKAVTGWILETFQIKVDESTVSRLKTQNINKISNSHSTKVIKEKEGQDKEMEMDRAREQELERERVREREGEEERERARQMERQKEVAAAAPIPNPTAKRHRQVMFPELERLMADYVQACIDKAILTDAMLVNKGKDLAEQLHIPPHQLSFSDGWLHKFKGRHGIKSIVLPNRVKVNIVLGPGADMNAPLDNNPLYQSVMRCNTPAAEPSGVQMSTSLSASSGASTTAPMTSSPARPLGRRRKAPPTAMDNEPAPEASSDDHRQPMEDMNIEQVLREHQRTEANSGDLVVSRPEARQDPTLELELLSKAYGSSTCDDGPPSVAARPSISTSNQHNSNMPDPTQRSQHASAPMSNAGLVRASASAVSRSSANPLVYPYPPSSSAFTSALRISDPAGERIIHFEEASQCVVTLRIFMQQQNFESEQLDQLRTIFLCLDEKRRQQEQRFPHQHRY